MKPPVTITVDKCASCPFVHDPDPDRGEESWVCTASEDKDGFYRDIGETQKRQGGPWLPPPKWCPLRTADHLVVLKVPKRRKAPR